MSPNINPDGFRLRILLVAPGPDGASLYGKDLEEAGFEVVYENDTMAALTACRLSANPVRAALIVDRLADGQATELAGMLCHAKPGLPCVLLPEGTASRDCEIAVRTAIRWTYRRSLDLLYSEFGRE